MNNRIKKKKIKKIIKWVKNNFDYLDDNGNYHTIPVKCHSCQFYMSEDINVGMLEGCECPQLYDKNDNIILEKDKEIIDIMSNRLGYMCPYYKKYIN